MTNIGNRDTTKNDATDSFYREDQSNGEVFEDSLQIDVVSSGSGSSSRSESGLTERLTDILVEEGNGDLLPQQSDKEDRVLQWLQALDIQFLGARRADERLKPMLKMNGPNGVAEDRLLAQLSQHFEPVEVGRLARCFCIPLVSLRVGKSIRQGARLCPTAIRGHLNLMVLPTSDFRLSFIGDDGRVERLFTLSSISQCNAVTVDEIPTDNSGRSFFIKMPHDQVFYFWCSEKSKLLGIELLAKMKDFLKRKPTISELTGISDSRLDCFATELRAYLVGSALGHYRTSSAHSESSTGTTTELSEAINSGKLTSTSQRTPRSRHNCSPALKAGSLSPRSSSFKEGLPRNLSSLKNAAKETLRQCVDKSTVTSPIATESSCSYHFVTDKVKEIDTSFPYSSSSLLESLGKFAIPPTATVKAQYSCMFPHFSPYYCWCPPSTSSLQYPAAPLPTALIEPTSLPPLSSSLPTILPSKLSTPSSSLSMSSDRSVDIPDLLLDPFVRLSMPTTRQIPTFTPLMCNPIVHVPVIDVCSSGQGYLVSAGPTISTIIPPLHPELRNPVIPVTDSVVEKEARETLRLLIGGPSKTNPPPMDVLPAFLTIADTNRRILVAGSRGMYSGNVDVIANSVGVRVMSLVSSSGGLLSTGDDTVKKCSSCDNLDAEQERYTG